MGTLRPVRPTPIRRRPSDAEFVGGLLSGSELEPGAIEATPARPQFSFADAATDATIPPSGLPAHRPPVVSGDTIAADDMRRALASFSRGALGSRRAASRAAGVGYSLDPPEGACGARAAHRVCRAIRAAVPSRRRRRDDVRPDAICERRHDAGAGHDPGSDGLPGPQGAAVRAARGDLERVPRAESEADSQQHDLAPADQPAVHRGVSRRPQSRVRARAAVARVPDRPARQLLPPVLGRVELRRSCRAAARSSSPRT